MNYLLTFIVFIVIFSVLILIHEFGHFIMAKRTGIRVEEFGFGLPPRIWGKKKGETLYSINWIPFGGFVRMTGQEGVDPKMVRSKRSFIGKPMRARVKVMLAGVLMNFLLAWVLLIIGFTAGMQPLLAPDDVLTAIDKGVIELVEGAKVKSVEKGSLAEMIGFKVDDIIFSMDGKMIDIYMLEDISDDPAGIYKIIRNDEIYTYEIVEDQVPINKESFSFGLEFYDYVPFPRVKIFDLEKGTPSYKAGLRKGDIILKVNGREIYSVSDFENFIRGEDTLEYEIYRNGIKENFFVELEQIRKVIISSVLPDMPADKVGFKAGDVIVSVNGNKVEDSLELIEFVGKHADENLAYLIERDGKEIFYEIKPEDGKIGVFLSELMTYGGEDISIYNTDLLSSVVEIHEQKYPFYEAVYKSLGEGIRLSKLTGKMFISFIFDLAAGGEVPESVAGPVGIAQLTHIFVQEGFISIIRFVAILSLSLAVINILPFPALDGGRLLFIVIEFIIGRRVNQKWESYIHALGYALILLLILAVTYNDIVRLISS